MATLLLSYSDIVGMPAEGSKLLRVWWEFEGNTDTFEDFDISDEVLPGGNGLFDWDGILEHSYDVRTSTDFRVRLELIVVGSTGNCARVRDVTVEPLAGVSFRFDGTIFGPSDTAAGPERAFGISGGTKSGWTEDGAVVTFGPPYASPVVVCSRGLGLPSGGHAASLRARSKAVDGNGLSYFILGPASTIGGVSAGACRAYTD